MKKSKIIFIASGLVLAIGSAFGAKAMFSKKADVTVYYTIGTGACSTSSISCTDVKPTGTSSPCVAGDVTYYPTSACGTPLANQSLYQDPS